MRISSSRASVALAACVAGVGLSMAAKSASAAPIIVDNVTAVPTANYEIGSATTIAPHAASPGSAYSNVTTFAGSAVTPAGATTGNLFTFAIADDLTPTSGGLVSQLKFTVANFNTATRSVLPSLRFYDSDGAGGAPGTLISGFNFNPVSVTSNNVSTFTFAVTGSNQFTIPNHKIWAMEFFGAATTVSGSGTSAVVNNFGIGLFNPPDVGTSAALEWDSSSTATSASSFASANPAGANYTSGYNSGALLSNFGWEIVVPEPASMSVIGLGMLGAFSARGRRRGA